jgi:hypothetical protein
MKKWIFIKIAHEDPVQWTGMKGASSKGGFLLAHQYDYLPGQMIVALFCLELAVAWIFRKMRQ